MMQLSALDFRFHRDLHVTADRVGDDAGILGPLGGVARVLDLLVGRASRDREERAVDHARVVAVGSVDRDRHLGRPLVEELAKRGATVRALSRTNGFDLADPSTYEAALEGAHSLFLLTPAEPRMVEMTEGIVGAARRAGVKRIVKVSALGQQM